MLVPNEAIACTSSEVEADNGDGRVASIGGEAIVGAARAVGSGGNVGAAADVAPLPLMAVALLTRGGITAAMLLEASPAKTSEPISAPCSWLLAIHHSEN